MTRFSTVSLPLLLLLGASASGCDDGGKPPFVAPEAGVKRDGGGAFLDPCQLDGDCSSGRCQAMGPSKRCSRACDSSKPCPGLGGWSCAPQSVCLCSYTGKQPDSCNVDGDCDGVLDGAGTFEVCNDKDDDCNGKIDDVPPDATGAKLYYKDADGDGHGDQNAALWSCKPPSSGYVENKTDCDDTRKDRNPGVTEVCGDDVDHDCDGLKWDADVCGLLPIVVPDVSDPAALAATIKSCGNSTGVDPSLDIIEIVAKQDASLIKFTVRLQGAPALASCSSYTLWLGSFSRVYDRIYVYRPATVPCAGLPELEVYQNGTKVSTKATVGFNAAVPGHVSFTIPKSEYLASLSTPSYYLKACSNAKADASKDLTDCSGDSCETPIRRE